MIFPVIGTILELFKAVFDMPYCDVSLSSLQKDDSFLTIEEYSFGSS